MTTIDRRAFLGFAAVIPVASAARAGTQATAVAVRAGQDRFDEHKSLGVSTIDIKVSEADSTGGVLVIENTNRAKGGPARHLHLDQDEHFYVIEGTYVIVVGQERFTLKTGDSIFAPRRIPHVWAYAGDAVGRLLITFTPAGRMEAFFRAVARTNAMPPQDPAIWRAHGMELLGPPLSI